MSLYYEDSAVRLFVGDAREILPSLTWDAPVALITDPVWPNAHPDLIGGYPGGGAVTP